jgi:spore coat polysaccharide biosynthesis protein SpsF (cytidylyltransferase family)
MEILPEASNANIKVRLTLDYEEDYWLLVSIIRILGSNPDRNKVRQLFLNNPDLTKINLFRNDEWKKAQLSKQL